MYQCVAELTEWQGVAVCEVCDWNENGSDGPHGERFAGSYASLAEQYKPVPNLPAEDNSDRRASEMVDDEFGFVAGCDFGPDCPCMYCDAADWDVNPDEWQCIHGVTQWMEAPSTCVLCRIPSEVARLAADKWQPVSKVTGEPYNPLPATVRDRDGQEAIYNVAMVRDVVTREETEVVRRKDNYGVSVALNDDDYPDYQPYVQRRAHHDDRVPRWFLETERGVTPRHNTATTWEEALQHAIAAEQAYLATEGEQCIAITLPAIEVGRPSRELTPDAVAQWKRGKAERQATHKANQRRG